MEQILSVMVLVTSMAAAGPTVKRYIGEYGTRPHIPPNHLQYTPAGQQYRPSPQYGGRDHDSSPPANYQFKYDVDAPEYGTQFGHQEARQGDVVQGRYYVLLPDGRTQTVEYVADQDGYRPKISYEGGGRGPQGGNVYRPNIGQGYGRGPRGPAEMPTDRTSATREALA